MHCIIRGVNKLSPYLLDVLSFKMMNQNLNGELSLGFKRNIFNFMQLPFIKGISVEKVSINVTIIYDEKHFMI